MFPECDVLSSEWDGVFLLSLLGSRRGIFAYSYEEEVRGDNEVRCHPLFFVL
jgi:hypothetical protein